MVINLIKYMYILGDIGNTETKIFIVSINGKIIKKIFFPSKNINQIRLNKVFNDFNIDFKKTKKILFCSVVPNSFNLIKKFLSKKTKVKCYEVKDLNLKSLLKIKDYPTTSLFELTNNHINKSKFENQLKEIFEKHLTKMYKIGNKFN